MSWSKACSLIEKPENKTCSINFGGGRKLLSFLFSITSVRKCGPLKVKKNSLTLAELKPMTPGFC